MSEALVVPAAKASPTWGRGRGFGRENRRELRSRLAVGDRLCRRRAMAMRQPRTGQQWRLKCALRRALVAIQSSSITSAAKRLAGLACIDMGRGLAIQPCSTRGRTRGVDSIMSHEIDLIRVCLAIEYMSTMRGRGPSACYCSRHLVLRPPGAESAVRDPSAIASLLFEAGGGASGPRGTSHHAHAGTPPLHVIA